MRVNIQLLNNDKDLSFSIKAKQPIANAAFVMYLEDFLDKKLTESDKKIITYFCQNIDKKIDYAKVFKTLNVSKSSFYRTVNKIKKTLFYIDKKVIKKRETFSFIKYEYI